MCRTFLILSNRLSATVRQMCRTFLRLSNCLSATVRQIILVPIFAYNGDVQIKHWVLVILCFPVVLYTWSFSTATMLGAFLEVSVGHLL